MEWSNLGIVYFDQLLGAARTQMLVELLFFTTMVNLTVSTVEKTKEASVSCAHVAKHVRMKEVLNRTDAIPILFHCPFGVNKNSFTTKFILTNLRKHLTKQETDSVCHFY